jgi:hypothetical protein
LPHLATKTKILASEVYIFKWSFMEEHEHMDDIKLIKHTDDFRLNVMEFISTVISTE